MTQSAASESDLRLFGVTETVCYSDTDKTFSCLDDILCGDLPHSAEGGKSGAPETLFVTTHLDGVQPLAHRGKGGVVGCALVQEGLLRRPARGKGGRGREDPWWSEMLQKHN